MSVRMYRTADSGNDPSVNPAVWVIEKPDGTVLSTTGTQTQGLQEAINYALAYGYNLHVSGGPVKGGGQDPSIINCIAPVSVPPMQKGRIVIEGCTLNFGPSMSYAMRFDSMMLAALEMPGTQVVCGPGIGIGILFKPENELPQDLAGPVITSSRFQIQSVVMTGTGTPIVFDASIAPISSNVFEIIEPNGGNDGVTVVPGVGSFDHNTLNIRDCHGQTTCIRQGNNSLYGQKIFGNTWNVQCDPRGGSVGVEMWGQNDDWIISVTNMEGQPVNGITLNQSAQKNRIHFLRNDATNKVNNASSYINSITGI